MKLIAYGSLMNPKSLERTLGRPARLASIVVPNYERVFNAVFGEYAFLNIRPSEKSTIEAAYFELTNEELKNFEEREAGSVVTEVLPGYFAFVWPAEKFQELPVLKSYYDFCSNAAEKMGINFKESLVLPATIIDDGGNPLYTG